MAKGTKMGKPSKGGKGGKGKPSMGGKGGGKRGC